MEEEEDCCCYPYYLTRAINSPSRRQRAVPDTSAPVTST